MDIISKTPGLQHISEEIFLNLDHIDIILECQKVNAVWNQLLRKPSFWLKKCLQMGVIIPENNPEEWAEQGIKTPWLKLIQTTQTEDILKDSVTHILMNLYENGNKDLSNDPFHLAYDCKNWLLFWTHFGHYGTKRSQKPKH